jgi:glycosyltransferase involved in cell wall biosynthesis
MSLSLAMAQQSGAHEIFIALNKHFADTVEPIRKAFDGLVPKDNILAFDTYGPVAEYYPANLWRARAAERVRESFLAQLAPDIVHVSSLFEGSGDAAVTSIGNLDADFSTAVTLYDLIPLLNKEIYLLNNPPVRDWYYRKLLSLKRAELLLAISESSRQEAISALQSSPDQAVNISSAVDSVFHPRVLSIEEADSLNRRYGLSKPFLMYTGGIDYRKNIDGLIQAFARLEPGIRNRYQLAIVCKIQDHDRQRLTQLAARCGLEKSEVVFTNFVPEEDLVALYNACALFVFPSLHEGFGLPVLEAMSCGAAVIGANTSSIPEVLGRDDAMFNPRDIGAIAAKIHQALTDDDFRASLQRHGLEQAKKFSWDMSAKRAWDAFEFQQDRRNAAQKVSVAVHSADAAKAARARPLLAYLSPLPPEKSGIADYSAELLPELARHYDIELIAPQTAVSDPWILANFPVRSVEWFEAHADSYDRVVYHFGNSWFHYHMFELLGKYPGVVVLHDFFMSGVLDYADFHGGHPGEFTRALYRSHGYAALADLAQRGPAEAIWKYPCNKWIFDQALGIVVHSPSSLKLAETWYGKSAAANCRVVPQLRSLPEPSDRREARAQLGFTDEDFLVCSFGLLGPPKMNDRLIDAWLSSPLAKDKRCHLIFVGENHGGTYGQELEQKIAASGCQGRIRITGFTSLETYRSYMEAADVAIQLRTKSRGETSRAILECMSYGLPTIINAHGSAADIPEDTVVKLADEFTDDALCEALSRLRSNTEEGRKLAQRAKEYIRARHHPVRCVDLYRDAIEQFSTCGPGVLRRNLLRSMASITTPVQPSEQDLIGLAASMAANRYSAPRQVLVDVSHLMQSDPIQTLAQRKILGALLTEPSNDCRVEPIYYADGKFLYATQFTLGLIGAQDVKLDEVPVQANSGDFYLDLDADSAHRDAKRDAIEQLYLCNVDILPLSLGSAGKGSGPDGMPPEIADYVNGAISASGEQVYFSRGHGNAFSDWPDVPATARRAARERVQVHETQFLLCVLCTAKSLHATQRFLNHWLQSSCSRNDKYRLHFLVETEPGDNNDELADSIFCSGAKERIAMASFAADKPLSIYLAAADLAVLLPSKEDGNELHNAIAGFLAYHVPVVADVGNAAALRTVIRTMRELRKEIRQVPVLEFGHMDSVSGSSTSDIYRAHLDSITAQHAAKEAAKNSRSETHAVTLGNSGRQILVDVSFLCKTNIRSGIQRVVYHILLELLTAPPAGCRVEPIYDAGGHYAYARRFTAELIGMPQHVLEDAPIVTRHGDIFLGLDLNPDTVRQNQHIFTDFKNHGVEIVFVVYDLLPILRPDAFPPSAQANFANWLNTVAKFADGVVGISRTVAEEISAWIEESKPQRDRPVKVGYFHLGAELAASARHDRTAERQALARPNFLMVGTIEPRKGYGQAIAAFEKLWSQGVNAELVMVGRQGWMVESLVAHVRTHPEYGKRLFWFEGASDETLLSLYEHASALLLASEGEGFGLPLVEAAQHHLPIIARDLPVFREVAGDHAYYFSGTSDKELADAIQAWLALYRTARMPSSEKIKWSTWADSARQLVDVVIGQHWHRTVTAAQEALRSAQSELT